MRTTRSFDGWGHHNHSVIHVTPGCPDRPVDIRGAMFRTGSASMSGPDFKGMDPSNPATYVRPWAPQPGMIGFLNFDGASMAMQGRTPTQLQRGPHPDRPRRLRIGP